jgi:2-polyprenyl-3-methyl-5-hydroxy-6-metoxy-1,4-benzoquinol methylase
MSKLKKNTNKKCMVCNNDTFIDLFQGHDRMFNIPGKFLLKKCKKCSLIFIDPQPSMEVLSKHYPAKNYYSYSINKDNLFEKIRTYLVKNYYNPNIIIKCFTKIISNVPALPSYKINSKILDVGCGAGDTLVLLKEMGWKTYGLEIDKQAVSIAKKRGLTVRLGTYKELSAFPNNYFDTVRLYHVIEHLDNPLLCLKLIRNKLKKDGEVILGTPNYLSLASKIFGKYWYHLDTPRHIFVFSPKNLQMLVKKAGFKKTKIEFCSTGGILGSLQYVVSSLRGKKINLLNKLWLFFLFYPLDWLLDLTKRGDVFVLRATDK